jgi:hypothetical protein
MGEFPDLLFINVYFFKNERYELLYYLRMNNFQICD